jgi:hypothetical protein
MKPLFLLLAKSHKPPEVGKPWWCLTEDQVLGHSVLYLYSPPDWPSLVFDADIPCDENGGAYTRWESEDAACGLLWVRMDPEGFNDVILVHEAVHMADHGMEDQGFEGAEIRAHLTEYAVRRVWATRNEPDLTPNAPMLDHLAPVVRRLRKLENGYTKETQTPS